MNSQKRLRDNFSLNLTVYIVLIIMLTSIISCGAGRIINDTDPKADSESVGETDIDILIHDKAVVHFATPEEGQHILGTADDWIKALSPFDRKSRMKLDREVSQEEFLSFAASHVVEWEQKEIEMASQAIKTAHRELSLSGVNLDLPEIILLVKTTGQEEGGAAYTRQNAIIMPGDSFSVDGLLHELFHVMTRHAPHIRKPLYAIIGFRPCSEVEIPDSFLTRKITNPDAYHNNFFIEISVDGKSAKAIPFIYSETDQYKGGNLFEYLTIKLMAIEERDGNTLPLLDDGEPVLLDFSQVTNFHEQIGQNTGYIIHPEETMAENFVFMIRGKMDLPNPEILVSIRKVLTR